MAYHKRLLAHMTRPLQVGYRSFPCCFASQTQVDGGMLALLEYCESHHRGKRGYGKSHAGAYSIANVIHVTSHTDFDRERDMAKCHAMDRKPTPVPGRSRIICENNRIQTQDPTIS